jgi:surfactin synthase thioesterase subunit
MIAAVTDLDGRITGAHRTWLNPSKCDKAPIDSPRRAMGHLLGNAVRFETARDVMAAGEGIETMLSLRASCRPCRWQQHSRPRTSPPSCSHRRLSAVCRPRQ